MILRIGELDESVRHQDDQSTSCQDGAVLQGRSCSPIWDLHGS